MVRFAQKIVSKPSKIWVWDPGSGKKTIFRIPDPGVKKAPDPDPQHRLHRAFNRNFQEKKPSASIYIVPISHILLGSVEFWAVFSASLT
jgi:hypothetical protein